MKTQIVYHHNFIGHEINESLEYYADDVLDREVYCRKMHQVKEPLEKECMTCPYFAGLMQGHGHECAWEDCVEIEHTVQHEDRYKEYERVDKLIKTGKLVDFNHDLIAKVKTLPYDANEWIYEQSEDRKSRFLLGKRGKKTLICCGVNPSTASPNDLEPTMKNVDAFAKANGYDSYLMINLYPMRATNPNDMHEVLDKEIVEKNFEYIAQVLETTECDIWAAWGHLIKTRKYLKDCLKRIVEIADTYQCTWYTIGSKTKEGHPHHPLYLSKECKMDVFDIHEYVRNLK